MARYAGGHDEFLRCSKIVSRQSSMSISSRIYYRSTGAAGVPFTWEMLPGEAKHKYRNEDAAEIIMPPLSPPPAMHSLSFPKPRVERYLQKKKCSSPSKLLLKLWTKMGKKCQSRALIRSRKNDDTVASTDHADVDLHAFQDFGVGSSTDNSSSHSLPCLEANNSSSSLSRCSSSSDSSNEDGVHEDVSRGKPFSRSNWRISKMVVACASATKRG